MKQYVFIYAGVIYWTEKMAEACISVSLKARRLRATMRLWDYAMFGQRSVNLIRKWAISSRASFKPFQVDE